MTDAQALAAAFAPHQELARRLLSALDAAAPAGAERRDGAHDGAHLLRVWRAAHRIAAAEPGCDDVLLAAAVLLHDCVAVEKDSPHRASASRLAAARARALVASHGWPEHRLDALAHAIEAHSYSAGIAPRTDEARILQDADRLDAIGAIGVARCFYTAGRIGSSLYDPTDPDAVRRPLDDRRFALDHFPAKLLRLGEGFNTATGRAMAAARITAMQAFLATLREEI